MAKKEEKSLEAVEQQVIPAEEMERTRERKCFVPKADIYETEEDIFLVADIPGADQDSVEITLEKDVLTISAFSKQLDEEDYSLAYSEYEPGDYYRSFRITNEIDREKIDAVVSNGELRLRLPKAELAKTKTIAVKAG